MLTCSISHLLEKITQYSTLSSAADFTVYQSNANKSKMQLTHELLMVTNDLG